MQTLLDIAADIPGILQDVDELKRNSGGTNILPIDLRQRIISTIRSLFSWRAQFQTDYPNIAYGVTVEGTWHLAHLRLPQSHATNSVWFEKFDRAHELMM